jgi:hypothetical protein
MVAAKWGTIRFMGISDVKRQGLAGLSRRLGLTRRQGLGVFGLFAVLTARLNSKEKLLETSLIHCLSAEILFESLLFLAEQRS